LKADVIEKSTVSKEKKSFFKKFYFQKQRARKKMEKVMANYENDPNPISH
jgi:hypothetical protein